MHIRYIAISALDIISLAIVIGALATNLWIVPEGARESFHRRLWRLTGSGLAALTISSFVLLVGRILEMSREPLRDVGHWLPLVLRETPFGHIWLIRPAMLIIAWAAWLMGRRPARQRATGFLILIAVAVIAFTRSATGHPADQGQWTAPEWVDFIHLMTASVWAGGLFAMTVAIFPFLPKSGISSATRIALVGNLSSVATIALAGILVTGILSAYHYVGSFAALRDSAYGHILLVKLTLVAVAVGLGAANRFLFVPRIRAGAVPPGTIPALAHESAARPLSLLIRSVAIETLFLMAVLVAAAALLHGMPPREMAHSMGGTVARGSQTPRPIVGRLEDARLEGASWMRLRPAISTVRYGVLRARAGDARNAFPLSSFKIPL